MATFIFSIVSPYLCDDDICWSHSICIALESSKESILQTVSEEVGRLKLDPEVAKYFKRILSERSRGGYTHNQLEETFEPNKYHRITLHEVPHGERIMRVPSQVPKPCELIWV